MEEDIYIAAIDIGSTDIIGGLLRISSDGILTLLSTKREGSEYMVRRGLIRNSEEITKRIENILEALNASIVGKNIRIRRVYVGINGQGLHTVEKSLQKNYATEVKITEQLLAGLNGEILMSEEFSPYKPFDVLSAEYHLNDSLELRPIGISCEKLLVNNVVILGRPSMKTIVEECLRKIGVEVAGFLIAPMEMSKLLLTAEEREWGCVLVDFGGNTTTISIFKKGILQKIVTLPFGGANITMDLMSLNLSEEQAEMIKRKNAHAIPNKTLDNKRISVGDPQNTDRFVYQNEVDEITSARIDEILENVLISVNEEGGKEALPSGFVITGGASRLNGLSEILRQKSKMKVRNASLQLNFKNSSSEKNEDSTWFMLLSLLLGGKVNCVDKISVSQDETIPDDILSREKDTKSPSKIKRVLDGVFNFGRNLINDEGGDLQ